MPVDPLPPGMLLGPGEGKRFRYKLGELEPLRSGYGLVYRAHDRHLGVDVRIKELAFDEISIRENHSQIIRQRHPDYEETQRLLTHRFEHEVRALSQIRSPHVVRVTDFWRQFGTAYYALEEWPGARPLTLWSPPDASDRWASIRRIAAELLDGLAATHRVGLLQSDFRPETIAVLPVGGAMIDDHGTARADRALVKRVTATPWPADYAAPELETPKDPAQIGPWTDLYSWGMTVFGLVLKHPTPSGRPVSALSRYQSDPYANAARELASAGVPDLWSHAVADCLTLDAATRPRSVDEIRQRVEHSGPAVSLDWERIAEDAEQTAVTAQREADSTRAWAMTELQQVHWNAEAAARQVARYKAIVWVLAIALFVTIALLAFQLAF